MPTDQSGHAHLEIDFGFRPDRTQRDGCHDPDDPIVCNTRATSLRELNQAGLLEGRRVPSEAIPPYLPGGPPAYMATLQGAAQGWEVTMGTFVLFFLPHTKGINPTIAVRRFLERRAEHQEGVSV